MAANPQALLNCRAAMQSRRLLVGAVLKHENSLISRLGGPRGFVNTGETSIDKEGFEFRIAASVHPPIADPAI
jgi:hypothetical protein